jgi:pyruvate/2-oxoglutarate dehydrogenase complex dihydrolipoamide acyltransferase (E2) component
MPTPILMPQLGESVTTGMIARWLKAEGDYVERDEPLVEIATDKVNAEMPSPLAGTIVRIVAQEGDTIAVGAEIARIEVESAVPAGAAPVSEVPTGARAPSSSPVDGGPVYEASSALHEDRRRYSPLVRRLAQEHHVDLSQVSGTGLDGRVTKDDVLAYLSAQQERGASARPGPAAAPSPAQALPAATPTPLPLTTEPAPVMPALGIAAMAGTSPQGATVADGAVAKAGETYLPLTPMRKVIAAHMVHSKQTAPHATTTIEVDMTRLVKWRERHKEAVIARHGVDITYVAMVMVALVDALKAFPIMNSSWGEDRIILKKRVNIGVAVALDDGLLVPVIHDADERNMVGLARAVADLATRARAGRLTLNDLQGGTFTLNNTGVFGAIVTTPVINQPEAAILAMNAIVKRPVVIEDDAIAVRSMMILSLSFDHRIVDGFTAGRFMQHIVKNINGLELPSV